MRPWIDRFVPIPRLSPDGRYYMMMGSGFAVPSPFSRRWLLPWIAGGNVKRWAFLTYVSLFWMPWLAAGFFHAWGLRGWTLVGATAMLMALPGVGRFSLYFPVLTDAPGYMLALGTAWSAMEGPWWLTCCWALVAGATRESGPVFAALWSLNPLPLIGLVGARWGGPVAPPDQPWLASPLKDALTYRQQLGFSWTEYVRPWGAAILGLAHPSLHLASVLAVGYGQLLIARDGARLYGWAAPVLVMAAVQVIPTNWLPLAVLVNLFV